MHLTGYASHVDRLAVTAIAASLSASAWAGARGRSSLVAPNSIAMPAARYASRTYSTLDNSDIIGNSAQGFYQYFVVDARVVFKVDDDASFALCVDTFPNEKYCLFHRFPQRSFTAQFHWGL